LRLAAACEDEASGERKRKVLSDEVRDFPLPLSRFIDLGESRSPDHVCRTH
jgi:hypothetical protein